MKLITRRHTLYVKVPCLTCGKFIEKGEQYYSKGSGYEYCKPCGDKQLAKPTH